MFRVALLLFVLLVSISQAQVKSPHSPADSLKNLVAHPEVVVELVAAEPLVVDPVAVRFDEFNRMWVVEMRDYPHGPKEGEKPKSRIRILQDQDQNGTYETATTFADNLLFATGLQLWKDGAFVTHAGKITYMRDTNGDLVADESEVWFTGFAEENTQLRANHPTLGLDGFIYVANGLRGGVVQGTRKGNEPVQLRGKDFRFSPKERSLYAAITGNGQFGLSIDSFGNRFVCSNRNPLKHVVFEDSQLSGSAAGMIGATVTDVAKAGAESRVYPIANAWTTSNLHAGQFTAACGVHLYEGDALGEAFVGNAFTCDPTGYLVHREVLKPAGPTFVSQPGRQGVEFLASRDTWFRPVNLTTGPDGSLYVVDMYRAVIEHPQFMPTELKTRPDLLLGNDRGRIYRVRAKSKSPDFKQPPLGKLKSDEVLAQLTSDNGWRRATALRLLHQNEPTGVATRLNELIQSVRGAPAKASSVVYVGYPFPVMSSLDRLAIALGLYPPELRAVMTDLATFDIRTNDNLRTAYAGLLSEENDLVRFNALNSFYRFHKGEEPLLRKAIATEIKAGGDPFVCDALLLAGQDMPTVALKACLAEIKSDTKITPAIRKLVVNFSTLASKTVKNDEQANEFTKIISATKNDRLVMVILPHIQAVAKRWTFKRDVERMVDLNERAEDVWELADKLVNDPHANINDRLDAVAFMAALPDMANQLLKLAGPEYPQSLRMKAISELAHQAHAGDWKKLLPMFETASPAIRSEIIRGLAAQPKATHLLVDLLEQKKVRPAEIDRASISRLQKLADIELRKRAAELLKPSSPAERLKALADFQASLKLKGDPKVGVKLFSKTCAACHKIGDIGVNVAPDISDSRTKTAAQILGDVILPNKAIDANYVSYLVETADGKTHAGIIAEETSAAIVLKMQGAKTLTIPREEIEQLSSTGVSLMPEGLEREMSHQQMADLISYIKNWRYLNGAIPIGERGP